MFTLEEWIKILTLAIALWGAILSTILAVREIKKERRSVKVTCSLGVGGPVLSDEIFQLVTIEAVNTGHRPVEIVSAGLRLSNSSYFTAVGSKRGLNYLPKKIEDGERELLSTSICLR